MTDRTQQNGDRQALSVGEAARHLGVTPDAVRARLHRGTLFGVKDDGGTWRVSLDGVADRQGTDRTHPVDRQDADRHADSAALVAVYEQLVESQREEIAFLRRELETRTDELQRRDVLLREALQRVPQLTSGENSSPGVTGDARTAPTAGQGDAIAPDRGSEASTGSDALRAPQRAWWRFWGRG